MFAIVLDTQQRVPWERSFLHIGGASSASGSGLFLGSKSLPFANGKPTNKLCATLSKLSFGIHRVRFWLRRPHLLFLSSFFFLGPWFFYLENFSWFFFHSSPRSWMNSECGVVKDSSALDASTGQEVSSSTVALGRGSPPSVLYIVTYVCFHPNTFILKHCPF